MKQNGIKITECSVDLEDVVNQDSIANMMIQLIWGSCDGDWRVLLSCVTVWSGRILLIFWRNLLSPSTRLKSKPGKQWCYNCCLVYISLLFNPEDKGFMFLQNIGKLLPDYTVICPVRWYDLCCLYFSIIVALWSTFIELCYRYWIPCDMLWFIEVKGYLYFDVFFHYTSNFELLPNKHA